MFSLYNDKAPLSTTGLYNLSAEMGSLLLSSDVLYYSRLIV